MGDVPLPRLIMFDHWRLISQWSLLLWPELARKGQISPDAAGVGLSWLVPTSEAIRNLCTSKHLIASSEKELLPSWSPHRFFTLTFVSWHGLCLVGTPLSRPADWSSQCKRPRYSHFNLVGRRSRPGGDQKRGSETIQRYGTL